MKKNIIRGILIILLIATFGIIFGFSNQDAEKSAGISKKITQILTENMKEIQEKPELEREKILSRIESIIRKIAHFSIYIVVGLLLMALVSTYDTQEMTKISISLITGVVYASSDEIHQCFTPRKRAYDN